MLSYMLLTLSMLRSSQVDVRGNGLLCSMSIRDVDSLSDISRCVLHRIHASRRTSCYRYVVIHSSRTDQE